MVKSILDLQDYLRNMSDDQLSSMMEKPAAEVPQFLIVSEISKRSKMRNQEKMDAAKDMTTVAEDVVNAAGVDNSGLPGMAQALAPKSSIEQNTGVNQVEAEGIASMAGGGAVRSLAGGSMGNVEPRPVSGVGRGGAAAIDNWDRLYGATHNPDGTPKALSSTESEEVPTAPKSEQTWTEYFDEKLWGKKPEAPTVAEPTAPDPTQRKLPEDLLTPKETTTGGGSSVENEYETLLGERLAALKGTDRKKEALNDMLFNIGAGLSSEANFGAGLSKGLSGAYESMKGGRASYEDDLLKLTREKQGIADTRSRQAAALSKGVKSPSTATMLDQISKLQKVIADMEGKPDPITGEAAPASAEDAATIASLKRQLQIMLMQLQQLQGLAGFSGMDLTEAPTDAPSP
tara:strand:- start:4381 stop:5586 length:1206 start_codon:yes stop_codon:yes gene_type:complete